MIALRSNWAEPGLRVEGGGSYLDFSLVGVRRGLASFFSMKLEQSTEMLDTSGTPHD